MFRKLFHALAVLSGLVLCCVAFLWARSGRGEYDAVLVRTARSYASGPRLKWVWIDTNDGLYVTLYVRTVPLLPLRGGAPWRDDVRIGDTGASVEMRGPSMPVHSFLAPLPVWRASARELTDAERRDYDAAVGPEYETTPWVCWQPNAPAFCGNGVTAPPVLGRLGIRTYRPDDYFIDHERTPGAYHVVNLRLPFALPAAAAAVLPLCLVPRLLRWRRTRTRLRARLCPACAYDLRSSPTQCPECGRPVLQAETNHAYRSIPRLVLTWPVRAPRRKLIARSVGAACLVGSAVVVVRHTSTALPTDETRRLRRELDAQLATVARRADRLRAAGSDVAAAQIDQELRAARRVAAGASPERRAGPALHVVGLQEFDYAYVISSPPVPKPPRVAEVEVTATDRPVVLVLCGYEHVTWRLKVAPRVRLEKVLLEGYRRQEVLDAPRGLKVEDHTYDGGNWHEYLSDPHDDNPDERWLNEALLHKRTGLRPRTWQSRRHYDGQPFVVGPTSYVWAVQCALRDLRPAYATAVREERDAALACVRGLRFAAPWARTAVPTTPGPFTIWRGGDSIQLPPMQWCVAEFDVTGPIESTIRPVPDARQPYGVFDRGSPTWFRADARSETVSVFDPSAKAYRHVRFRPGAPSDDARFGPMALDPRRRRLLVVGRENVMLSVYSLDLDTTESTCPIGVSPGLRSIAYSPHDDCFYALGPAPAQIGQVMTITRITPDGTPLWQIPVTERVGDSGAIGQLYAAGKYLVIVTPAYPDPVAPAAPRQRRCVVLDPATNRIVYSGPMAPHADGAPPGRGVE